MLLKIRDDIVKAMKASELTLTTMIDFSKAFDTIAHDVLIKKMQKIVFSKFCFLTVSNNLHNET